MQHFTTAIPISADAYQGLGTTRGMLTFDGSKLILEFQTEDNLFGIVKSAAKRIEIPLQSITGIRSRDGFLYLFPDIQIDLSDFQLLSKFPSAAGGAITVNVRWKDRKRSQEFVSTVNYFRTKQLHDLLERDLVQSHHDKFEAEVLLGQTKPIATASVTDSATQALPSTPPSFVAIQVSPNSRHGKEVSEGAREQLTE
jgi:hypothetical protein